MDLEALRTFVVVVDEGSFTRAASALGVAKSTVSQRVRDLEAALGVPLLQRSTRKMSLTAAGQELFTRGHDIVGAASEAQLAIAQMSAEAVGTLRVSVPVSFGERYLGRLVAELLVEHPRLEVVLDLADRAVNLIEDRYDVALRVGGVTEPNLIAQRVGTTRHRVVAAPAYVRRHGEPRSPQELQDHECLLFAHQREPDTWRFEGPDGSRMVKVSGRLRANHGDVLADAAMAGLGLAWLPDFIVEPAIERGDLQVLLDEHCVSPSPIHIVSVERRLRPLKTRLFIDAVRARLSADFG